MADGLRIGSLNDLPESLRQRVRQTIQLFEERIGSKPQLVVVAPGRVNLIGEHTDYNGFPVLPAATDRTIVVAAQVRRDPTVDAFSTAYPQGCRFSLDAQLCRGAPGDWGNYVKAGATVVQELCSHPRGATMLVDSTIPAGAGLSSSSALVVASGLALLAVNGLTAEPLDLAERFAAAERFVGTLSGGMDQAIALLAQAGTVLHIDFFPLRIQPIPFPAGYAIVVCHSLVRAEKSGGAKTAYNRRVWECTIGCRALAYILAQGGQPLSLQRLADVTLYYPSWPLSRFVDALEQSLPRDPLTVAEVAAVLRVPLKEFLVGLQPSTSLDEPLALVRRLRHVFTEAERVQHAVDALKCGEIKKLAQAMTESHASCRDNYEVSCPELEELVAVAHGAGALGARLTGAGFGGATVQLLPHAAVADFFAHVDRQFYRQRTPAVSDLSQFRFAFVPGEGARVTAV